MAEAESVPKKQHRLPIPHPNSTTYFTRFLYKSAFVLLFLVIIPLFPSQAPEFIHQSFPTRSWEVLHLIFVGIAVSYGLFSRRNEEIASDKETSDNAPSSYISRIFQVSSVFDDDVIENSPPAMDKNNKVVQTWSSEYIRNDPVVMVEKPLLLPIRSLKTSISDETKHEHEPSTVSGSVAKDDRVLPSPIPWRSRSGRMELKEGINQRFGPIAKEEHRLSRSQTLEPPRIRVSDSSQSLRLSPTKSSSLESRKPRSGEDFVRKKSSCKSNPIPPPPPPPPPMIPKSSSMRPPSIPNPLDKEVRRVQSGIEQRPRSITDDLPPKSVKTIRSGNGKARVEDEKEGSEFVEIPKEEKMFYFVEGLVSQSDEDPESESDDGNEASTDNGGAPSISDGGPDVDKKADEFIAKFREQIRLQRIESIRSSVEMSKMIHR